MAILDIHGFVAGLKDHVADHGFHIHDERHFVETYSLRQAWEVDLHPDQACGGPLDLHLAVEVDPRTTLAFEDQCLELLDDDEPPRGHTIPILFTWTLPPLVNPPDLLTLTTDVAGVGGPDLPLQVAAIDSTAAVTDAAEHTLTFTSRVEVDLADILTQREELCDTLERARLVSEFLLDNSTAWLEVF